ncbi:MAG: LptF/LptG family permease [Rhodobacteraceae bacterium]|nr:LptF/LptG family permease [Paracoccaceae bacterium]
MTFALYLTRRFLLTLGIVFGSFLLLVFLFELESHLSGYSSYGIDIVDAIGLSMLSMVQEVRIFVPITFALASLWMSVRLGASSEITVVRSAGTPGYGALAAPVFAAMFLGVLLVTLVNPAGAILAKRHAQIVGNITGNQVEVYIENSGYLWFRKALDGQQTILRASSTHQGQSFEDVHIFVFDSEGAPFRRYHAETAEIFDTGDTGSPLQSADTADWPELCIYRFKSWEIRDSVENPEADAQTGEITCFATNLTAAQVRESFVSPTLIPLWQLPQQIQRLELSGFSAVGHQVQFHMELAKPILLAAMVLIGGAFTLRHTRAINLAAAMLASVLCTLGAIFLQEFARILAEVGAISPLISAWVPPAAAIFMAVAVVSYLEGK